MSKLDNILEKIKERVDFLNEYDVTMETRFDSSFIRIRRKDTPLEDRLVYNPKNWGKSHENNFCFEIYHFTSYYMFSEVYVKVVVYNQDSEYHYGWHIGEPPLKQSTTFYDADVPSIVNYIVNKEWEINNKRHNKTTFLPSNQHYCEKCRAVMHRPMY